MKLTQEILEKTNLGGKVKLVPVFDGLGIRAEAWVLVKKYNASGKRWFLLELHMFGEHVLTYRIGCKNGEVISGDVYASK